jgi:hypothetical protein
MSESKVIKLVPPKTEGEELVDAIFGPDEEISDRVSEDILETHGIWGEQLVERFKARLQERIKEERDRTGTVPQALEATLRNVRQYQKERAPKTISADEWVSELFNVTLVPNTHSQALYDFRNRGTSEVSIKDRKILDDLKTELESGKE